MQSNLLKYVCPVCGFLLDHPAKDFNICPSCGVEFDADTVEYSVEELRSAWENRGMEWSSPVIARPPNFNAVAQLKNLDMGKVSSSFHSSSGLQTRLEDTQESPSGTQYRFGPSSVTRGHLRYRIA
jgi:hypothetical protein